MADNSIVQGAAGGPVVPPTWGTLDGAAVDAAGVSMEQILANVKAMLEDDLNRKADIDHTHNYETDLTNTPTLGSMASVNDAPATGLEYVRKNRGWVVSSR